MIEFPPILDLPRDDTIVAISTPPGRGALGIIRISGPKAVEIAGRLWSGSAEPAELPGGSARAGEINIEENISDTAVLTIWRAPKSYTGQDLAEFTLHGSPPLLAAFEISVIECGARPAAPGEFTLRAILNGKIPVSKAGAIAALIEAPNIAAARAASRTLGGEFGVKTREIIDRLDDLQLIITAQTEFPEDVEGPENEEFISRIENIRKLLGKLLGDLKAGAKISETQVVVIAGPPNVGKSTLANVLLGRERSIVHHEPGTTRDLVEAECTFGEINATLVDTAGLRRTENGIELIGVDLAHRRLAEADLVILLLDASSLPDDAENEALAKTENANRIIALNKSDLGIRPKKNGDIKISAKTGDNIDGLREMISRNLFDEESDALWASSWQIDRVQSAMDSVNIALSAVKNNAFDAASTEIIAADRDLRAALGEDAPDDIIARVLEDFCVGK